MPEKCGSTTNEVRVKEIQSLPLTLLRTLLPRKRASISDQILLRFGRTICVISAQNTELIKPQMTQITQMSTHKIAIAVATDICEILVLREMKCATQYEANETARDLHGRT